MFLSHLNGWWKQKLYLLLFLLIKLFIYYIYIIFFSTCTYRLQTNLYIFNQSWTIGRHGLRARERAEHLELKRGPGFARTDRYVPRTRLKRRGSLVVNCHPALCGLSGQVGQSARRSAEFLG